MGVMKEPNVITLIAKNISLNVIPFRRTIRWIDEDGIARKKMNQLRIRVDFKGTYENEFHAGDILYDIDNHIKYEAVSKTEIRNIHVELERFAIPSRVLVIAQAFIKH